MPTSDELFDLAPGIGQRASTVRFDVLDGSSLVKIGTVQPMEDSEPSITMSAAASGDTTTANISRTLRGVRLTNEDQAELDPFGHRLRPVWVLENGAEFPLGVFVIGSMDRVRREYGLEPDATGVDLSITLDQPLERSFTIKGGPIRDRIVSLLSRAGVTNFSVDLPDEASVNPASPLAYPAGTSGLRIMNELATLAGAWPFYFDRSGWGRVRPIIPLSEELDQLTYEAGGRIIADSMVETDELLSAPNRYLVIDSSNTEHPIVGFYDVPSEAPHSYDNRYFRVVEVHNEQGLRDTNAAVAHGRALYLASGGGYRRVKFASPPDARHDVLDCVSYLGTRYREVGWSLPLSEGSSMTHDLEASYA